MSQGQERRPATTRSFPTFGSFLPVDSSSSDSEDEKRPHEWQGRKKRLLGPNEVQCPYNPAHVLSTGPRFQRHLLRCRQSTRGDPLSPFCELAWRLEICPYNALHHVEDMSGHLERCADFALTKMEEIWVPNPSWMQNVPPVNSCPPLPIGSSSSDWDAIPGASSGGVYTDAEVRTAFALDPPQSPGDSIRATSEASLFTQDHWKWHLGTIKWLG